MSTILQDFVSTIMPATQIVNISTMWIGSILPSGVPFKLCCPLHGNSLSHLSSIPVWVALVFSGVKGKVLESTASPALSTSSFLFPFYLFRSPSGQQHSILNCMHKCDQYHWMSHIPHNIAYSQAGTTLNSISDLLAILVIIGVMAQPQQHPIKGSQCGSGVFRFQASRPMVITRDSCYAISYV